MLYKLEFDKLLCEKEQIQYKVISEDKNEDVGLFIIQIAVNDSVLFKNAKIKIIEKNGEFND